MVSASSITERLPELPDLPVDVGEVTDRLRGLTGAATSTARNVATGTAHHVATTARQATASGRMPAWRRLGGPLAVLGVLGAGMCLFFLVRSRRRSTEVGTAAPAGTYAHT